MCPVFKSFYFPISVPADINDALLDWAEWIPDAWRNSHPENIFNLDACDGCAMTIEIEPAVVNGDDASIRAYLGQESLKLSSYANEALHFSSSPCCFLDLTTKACLRDAAVGLGTHVTPAQDTLVRSQFLPRFHR